MRGLKCAPTDRSPERGSPRDTPVPKRTDIHQTGRLCRVNPNTVARYRRIAGEPAKDAHDELVAISPPDDRDPTR